MAKNFCRKKILNYKMLCTRRLFQQWSFAVFLLCSSVPCQGRPIDAVSNRVRRAVSEHQLLHDKGRSFQELQRRIWLQNFLDEVHTAEIRELPSRTTNPKPAGSTKNYPIGLGVEEEGTYLPQETNKSQIYKDQPIKANGKKKKGRSGKRRENDKKKRRARSIGLWEPGSEYNLEWAPYFSLGELLH
ncbi:parathyroid hormone-related protein-like [Acipenser oxyrinchus oxyrinchus]|uniref:Parathyroid hormone-related protein-like n=1 Tax=Acipenser oxyrinchus oxyrinchus TaxID=40147 RepID=A0AAD8G7K7_ACIOX|nr:parathyroid hormone-related protein-like [Acipenser oxyrinchus oxyrinchus]